MPDLLKRILTPPVFEGDEDKTRVAALLNATLWIFIAIELAAILVFLFLPNPELSLPLVGVFILGNVISLWLMHRGRLSAASLLFLASIWILMTAVSVFYGGTQSASYFGSLVVVITAGLLLGGRGGIAFAGLSVVTGIGIAWAQSANVLPSPLGARSPIEQASSLSLFVVVTAGLVNLASRGLNDALLRARRYAVELKAQSDQLEELVQARTQDLARRTNYLGATTAVAQESASVLGDPQQLLSRVVDVISQQFGLYHAGLFLVDSSGEWAELRAASSEGGRRMLARGHRLRVGVGGIGQGIVGHVAARGEARIALDTGADAVFFDNPDLPDTRSEAALPLRVREEIIGVLDVQSVQKAAFDESSIATLQGVADQIAVAVENARLFAQTQATLSENQQLLVQVETGLQETMALYEASQTISAAPDNAGVFQAVVDHVSRSDIDLCLLVLFDPYEGNLPQQLEISQVWARLDPSVGKGLEPGGLAGRRFDFAQFPLRGYLRADAPQVVGEHQLLPDSASRQMWNRLGMQTLAFLPLKAGARWIGALGLGTRQVANAFKEDALRPYQAMASQAAIAIENRRLFASSEARLHELSELYRSVTGKAWGTFLQAQPTTTEYEFSQVESVGDVDNVWRIPLKVRGQDIGLVELESDRQTWSEQERALVEAVVTQTALALDGARLFEQTQRLAGRERLINEITGRIRASTGVPGILQTAARELATAMNVPHAVARISLKAEEPRDPHQGTDDQTA